MTQKKFNRIAAAIAISITILASITLKVKNSTAESKKKIEPVTQVELILDASGSMWGKIKKEFKINIAKKALYGLINELNSEKNIQVALRVYGHRNKRCNNTILEIPMGKLTPKRIKRMRRKIKSIRPKGRTPISFSLLKSAKDFKKKLPGKKVIILLTDGLETCKTDPCKVAKALKEKGIITKINVVGFGMGRVNLNSLKCIPKPFKGIFITADNSRQLKKALKKIKEKIIQKEIEPGKGKLIVHGRTPEGRVEYVFVDVYRGGKKIKSAEGEQAEFLLQKGMYNLRIKSRATKKEKFLKGVQVEEGYVAKREVIIVKTKRDIISTDSVLGKAEFSDPDPRPSKVIILVIGEVKGGRALHTTTALYESETGTLIKVGIKSKVHEIITKPGNYEVRITDLETGGEKVAQFSGLKKGSITKKRVVFERGMLVLVSKNANGTAMKTTLRIYDAKTKKIIKKSPGKIRHEIALFPGTYDLKMHGWYTKEEKLLLNVAIKNGIILEKEVIMGEN
ncbi:MAG: VWA domain-containing protein [bacterium]|nr:VWA domain-containing protein [bacterium]